MNTRKLFLSSLICLGLLINASAVNAQTPQCVPGFTAAFQSDPTYTQLKTLLQSQVSALTSLVSQVSDQASYQSLLTRAHAIANALPSGRLVVTEPDGTVIVDTSQPDDPNNSLPQGNSYQHFLDKTVNENHNSRVAIFTAQEWPCGQGLETKLSTTTNERENYFAIRLGQQFNNQGTARLSVKAGS